MPPIVGVPALCDVRVLDRSVVADLLADPPRAQHADEQRRADDRDDERGARRHEHRDHDGRLSAAIDRRPREQASATPRARRPGSPCTSTASPGSRSRSHHERRRVRVGRDVHGDTACRSAARPISAPPRADADQRRRCRARPRPSRSPRARQSLWSPSSRMSPSTAIRRPVTWESARARAAPLPSTSGSRCTRRSARRRRRSASSELHPPARARAPRRARRRSRRARHRTPARRVTAAHRGVRGPGARRASGTVKRVPAER